MKYLSLLLVLAFWACGGGSVTLSTPEESSKGLLKAIKAEDFTLAKKYVSKRTRKNIENLKTEMLNMGTPEEKAALKRIFQSDFADPECEEVDGKMRCRMCCTPDSAVAEFFLVQQDNQWLVEFDMEL
ncbi:MAG: hypothetical protein MK212_15365 [Saprospiraceae bacterium]|nr:hypothetical protein [Saprospiraceae bacterium]